MRANLEGVQNLTATLSAVSTLAFTLQEYAVMHCILTPVSQPRMEATLSAVEGLSASLSGTGDLTGYLTIPPYVSGATYEGPYTVQPKWHDQVLDTANKVMTADVEVESIYINSAENLSGGNTVYIGV